MHLHSPIRLHRVVLNSLNSHREKLRGLRLLANYTDQATAACRRSCQLLRIAGATNSYGRILTFLDRSHQFFFPVAPQLYSRGSVDPVTDPLLLRKSGTAGNRNGTSGFVGRNSDHYTAEAVKEGITLQIESYILLTKLKKKKQGRRFVIASQVFYGNVCTSH
jgi:hypothetical protein